MNIFIIVNSVVKNIIFFSIVERVVEARKDRILPLHVVYTESVLPREYKLKRIKNTYK